MPVEFAVWRIGQGITSVGWTPFPDEKRLEALIEEDPRGLLGEDVLLLGRQVDTAFGKRIDLLGIDIDGDLHVIELKRDKTPRDIVGQLLDYASWVQTLGYEDVLRLWEPRSPGQPFEEAFFDHFGINLPDTLNTQHHLLIVASELDASTERIVQYLSESYSVPLNAVFFRYFQSEGQEFLARTWLVDPLEAESRSTPNSSISTGAKEPWNGHDFYVALSQGGDDHSWEDCQKYGFVSAGGGQWFTRTLRQLTPGSRVFAHIPKEGYVGVGEVLAPVVAVNEFTVEVDGQSVPILAVPLVATKMGQNADNPDLAEHLVRVKWLNTRPRAQAFWRAGLFANQNIACKLRNKFTIDTLTAEFGLAD